MSIVEEDIQTDKNEDIQNKKFSEEFKLISLKKLDISSSETSSQSGLKTQELNHDASKQ